MRKLIVHQFISLDGVIQAPGSAEEDTDGGFAHGGWTIPFWHNDIGIRFSKAMETADALLLGRKTWKTHGDAFEPLPPAENPFGDIKKYVVSTTLKSSAAWSNSTIISKNVVEEVRKLKEQSGKNILLDGSSVLAHRLIENDLVDEFFLHLYPLVLGGGKKLFPDGKYVKLKLIESAPLPTGVVYLHYELVR
jgi:dihydrofolate reductase